MMVYVDASALVKRYIAEAASVSVDALIAQANVMGTGLISRVEVSAALAKAARMNWLTREAAVKAVQSFRAQWSDIIGVEITEAVVAKADTLAWDHGLRGYDAVHLACALLWQEAIGEPITLATFDRQLWDAAHQVGLEVWPDTLA
ncbi:MAG TPA: type II toxin-antitoxin system VapC family toxin [Anaerolineae bacterium]|nr:type II toxin-antitoxin system VapC family toxin [Anaerolineae bacterium]